MRKIGGFLFASYISTKFIKNNTILEGHRSLNKSMQCTKSRGLWSPRFKGTVYKIEEGVFNYQLSLTLHWFIKIRKSVFRSNIFVKHSFLFVAGTRVELVTSGLWIRRSNHLSYPAIFLRRCKDSFFSPNAKLFE